VHVPTVEPLHDYDSLGSIARARHPLRAQ
jgi:hypothetical protein